MKTLFGRGNVPQEAQFNEFVDILDRYERNEFERHEDAVRALYSVWAEKFELLKGEFNAVWDSFVSLEHRLTGWFAVSPNLAPWKSVACGRGGYTFAACMMKNHDRHAPLSEKSLSVSFALDGLPAGIGDERWIGYQGIPTDTLAGFDACRGREMSAATRLEGAKALVERVGSWPIIVRLNHRTIGQQTATLPLSILSQHSLRELCQGLFVLLNNDVLSNLQAAIAAPEQLLLAGNDQILNVG